MTTRRKSSNQVPGDEKRASDPSADARMILAVEKSEILSALTAMGHVAEDDPERWQDREFVSEDPAIEVQYRRREALLKRLRNIEDAVRTLERGGYGVCRDCGAAINPRRLEADPAVSLCLACQTAAETLMAPSSR